MKTRTQLEHLINTEAAKITRLQKEDNAIWTRKSPPELTRTRNVVRRFVPR